MRSLPPIYIPTCSSEDMNSDIADDPPLPASPSARVDYELESGSLPDTPVRNDHQINSSDRVTFSFSSSKEELCFEDLKFDCTVEYVRKKLELELGVPSDAFQLELGSNDGTVNRVLTKEASQCRLLDLVGCIPATAVYLQIEISPILQRTFKMTFEGNLDEITSSGTLDLLNTPLLKKIPCEEVIDVIRQRAFLMMYLAANRGHFGIVEAIIKRDIDPNTCTPFGRTPLHVAAFHGQIDVLELLLSHGADVSHQDCDGMIAQEISANRGHTDCIRRLWIHRWNLRPPILTMFPQKQHCIGSPRYLDVCGRTTPSKITSRTSSSLESRARDVVKLWSMECNNSRSYSPFGNSQPGQTMRIHSKSSRKSNPCKRLHTGDTDCCRDTTRDAAILRSRRSPTVSICTVVNLQSPFIVAEISPLPNDESISTTNDGGSQFVNSTKGEHKRYPQINHKTLMTKLTNIRRPVVATERTRPNSPPDFQTWLTKKKMEAKEEATIEKERKDKTARCKNERKEMSEIAYKNWLTSKRRNIKSKSTVGV